MNLLYYLNDDHTYRPCDAMEWEKQFQTIDRHVASDVINDCHISTVWLGMDHSFYGGKPLLLETMVFDNKLMGTDIYMMRYTTWDEAVEGHQKAIEWVQDGCHENQ